MLDTITILGSRGSGKTSFLESVAAEYKKDSDIEVIDIIDPTLIEEKGHIFLTIISHINEKVESKLKNSSSRRDECEVSKRKEWDCCIGKLAAGLPTIDGIGGNMDGWDDPKHILNKGLNHVNSAIKLSANFNGVVNKALEILGKKAFILMLDDVDINFQKGWPLLEVVRKYLTTPQIITFVSGDINLFSKAVRKQQWGNFGKALLKNEGEILDRMDTYNDMVTEMESQYLQKVLKPESRIKLTTLLEKKNNLQNGEEFEYKVNADGSKEGALILEVYKELLGKFGVKSALYVDTYSSYLLSLPIRSQIQLLKVMSLNLSCLVSDDVKPVAIDDIINIYLSDLYENGVDVNMTLSSPKRIVPSMLKLLIDKKSLNDAYQFTPITLDNSINSCYTAFTHIYGSATLNNPFLIFDYLIKIGYLRNLLPDFGYQDIPTEFVNNSNTSNELSINGLIKHSALYFDRNIRDSACYIAAYLRASIAREKVHRPEYNTISSLRIRRALQPYAGTICLYSEISEFKSSLADVFCKANNSEYSAAMIPACKISFNGRSSTTLVYSIYTLFGAIAEMLKINKNNPDQVRSYINSISQIRSYPTPTLNNDLTNYIDDLDLEEYISDSDSVSSDETLIKSLIEWMNDYNNISVSPYVLDKISTRFFHAIGNINKHISSNLGDHMQMHVIAFLNSVLVEDARENGVELSNDNPASTYSVFIQNIKNCNKEAQVNLSRWIMSCPLLLCYLNEEVRISILNFLNKPGVNSVSIYDYLQKVLVNLGRRYLEFKVGQKDLKATINHLQRHFPYSGIERRIKEKVMLKKYLERVFQPIQDRSLNSFISKFNDGAIEKW